MDIQQIAKLIREADDNLFKVTSVISANVVFENPIHLEDAFNDIDNHPNF